MSHNQNDFNFHAQIHADRMQDMRRRIDRMLQNEAGDLSHAQLMPSLFSLAKRTFDAAADNVVDSMPSDAVERGYIQRMKVNIANWPVITPPKTNTVEESSQHWKRLMEDTRAAINDGARDKDFTAQALSSYIVLDLLRRAVMEDRFVRNHKGSRAARDVQHAPTP